MREDRKASRWVGWVSAAIVAVLMAAAFALAGGVGPEHSAASPATQVSYDQGSNTGINSITIANSCASSPTISGTVVVTRSFTGKVTLGLFYLSQDPQNDFRDTGRRATAKFVNSTSAPYVFSAFEPVPGSPAYVVKVVDASSGLSVPQWFTHSLAVPVCQFVTTTATKTNTTTATKTNTTMATTTQTNTRTVTRTGTTTQTNTTTVLLPTTTTAFVTGTTTDYQTVTTSVLLPTTVTETATVNSTETATTTYSVTYTSTATATETTTTTTTTTAIGRNHVIQTTTVNVTSTIGSPDLRRRLSDDPYGLDPVV